jgi:uncharacterized metal-binding protein
MQSKNPANKLVYSCSGCSSAAQMANRIAVNIDRKGIAEMSCIAGVGGGVKALVSKAKSVGIIIGIDGCRLHCVKHCLKKVGLSCTVHYDLSNLGVLKEFHRDFDQAEAERVEKNIIADINLM